MVWPTKPRRHPPIVAACLFADSHLHTIPFSPFLSRHGTNKARAAEQARLEAEQGEEGPANRIKRSRESAKIAGLVTLAPQLSIDARERYFPLPESLFLRGEKYS